MISLIIKSVFCGFIGFFSAQAFATDTIKVTVQTKEKKAVAIGYTVEKNQFGGLGNSFTGTGPINKEYLFGYRKDSIFGDNISCGSLTLTHDSTIILIKQDKKCQSIIG